ncbi:ABC transporter permease [Candidatus Micrarchaeota archaeon]|nr:ABC transporter permease [Candidatus Micrarchaeota archaeon]
MRLDDTILYAVGSLRKRKLRSWLTIIGIIIGITTIVSIVSIGDGLRKDIQDQLDQFGSNQMFVIPVNIESGGLASYVGTPTGRSSSGKLYERDAENIEGIPGVVSVSKAVYGRANVEFKGKEITATIYGMDSNIFDIWEEMYYPVKGRVYSDNEKRVVYLGNDAANLMFGKNKVDVGNKMEINNEEYRVVGIMKKIGSSMSQSDDSAIYIPFDQGVEVFGSELAKGEVSMILIQIDEGYNAEELKESVEYELMKSHKVSEDDKDFSVITAEYMNEIIGSILDIVSTFLLLIAMIASVVSAIGITNTMFMSVMEKVKEIGVLKAVGASDWDLQMIFLIESGTMGLIGGLIGILLGYGVAYVVSTFGIVTYVSLQLTVFALLFAVGVGIAAGVFPARRAAKLSPIEAFRY